MLAEWQRFPKLALLPPLTSLQPHGFRKARMWRLTTYPLGLTPVVWRLAQVCKLPLTLSVNQNPPAGVLRLRTPVAQTPDCSGSVMACGLATVSGRLTPDFPRRRLSTLRFRKLTRTTDDTLLFRSRHVVWRLAQVCKLPLTLFGESEPPGRIIATGSPIIG